jgi:trans-aconitate 2-methyltransferase
MLAVQMPRQHLNPTHQILFALARERDWAPVAAAGVRDDPVAGPQQYYDWLIQMAGSLDIWETEYLHVLEGENAVLNWVMGSVARPVLDRLDPGRQAEFLRLYGERLIAAYPPRPDGKTLLPFRRIFMVAQRA